MSSKVIAFAGSNSSTSINHKLVSYVAGMVEQAEVEVIHLTDFPLPIYSEDTEKEEGFPSSLESLIQKLKSADGLIISVNEHNSGWSSFFKNTMDWLSRLERKYLDGIPVLLLSTSPGGRGGQSSLEFGVNNLPRVGAEVVTAIAIPRFYDIYDAEKEAVTSEEVNEQLQHGISILQDRL